VYLNSNKNLNNSTYLDLLYDGSIDNLIKEYPKVEKKAKEIYLERKKDKESFELKKKTLRNTNFINNYVRLFKKFLKIA